MEEDTMMKLDYEDPHLDLKLAGIAVLVALLGLFVFVSAGLFMGHPNMGSVALVTGAFIMATSLIMILKIADGSWATSIQMKAYGKQQAGKEREAAS